MNTNHADLHTRTGINCQDAACPLNTPVRRDKHNHNGGGCSQRAPKGNH